MKQTNLTDLVRGKKGDVFTVEEYYDVYDTGPANCQVVQLGMDKTKARKLVDKNEKYVIVRVSKIMERI